MAEVPATVSCGKRYAAIKAVERREWIAAIEENLQAHFDDLGERFDIDAYSVEGQTALLMSALKEIRPYHYDGDRPPAPSVAISTRDLKLWIFRWKSEEECFGRSVMYIKFCIVGAGEKGPVYIHSLHIDNPPENDGLSE
jgi:hypothetical protein